MSTSTAAVHHPAVQLAAARLPKDKSIRIPSVQSNRFIPPQVKPNQIRGTHRIGSSRAVQLAAGGAAERHVKSLRVMSHQIVSNQIKSEACAALCQSGAAQLAAARLPQVDSSHAMSCQLASDHIKSNQRHAPHWFIPCGAVTEHRR